MIIYDRTKAVLGNFSVNDGFILATTRLIHLKQKTIKFIFLYTDTDVQYN